MADESELFEKACALADSMDVDAEIERLRSWERDPVISKVAHDLAAFITSPRPPVAWVERGMLKTVWDDEPDYDEDEIWEWRAKPAAD